MSVGADYEVGNALGYVDVKSFLAVDIGVRTENITFTGSSRKPSA